MCCFISHLFIKELYYFLSSTLQGRQKIMAQFTLPNQDYRGHPIGPQGPLAFHANFKDTPLSHTSQLHLIKHCGLEQDQYVWSISEMTTWEHLGWKKIIIQGSLLGLLNTATIKYQGQKTRLRLLLPLNMEISLKSWVESIVNVLNDWILNKLIKKRKLSNNRDYLHPFMSF